ncbi:MULTISPECIES: hypothetical protein [unclassified Flavobacterium]|uniref:hypothetical protein n=1 Tax=unclassified Flavobacterium TaxID=196869 RepID=UPI00095F14C8|nr:MULTISPECIES: hypothetical protein [unclassified Flavobacterium]MBN9284144.1 hypothetical protein [Flavobacterium sp.]OJV71156.1 MAG: hypothetical protein BGO42_04930 [Flavobacterium sp. 40-81]
MNKYKLFFTGISLLVVTGIYSQTKFKTEFYTVTVPENTTYTMFNTTREAEANIDIYEFGADGKIKYLLYLMSNKMSGAVKVDENNFEDFLTDLYELVITDIEKQDGNLKIYFSYNDSEFVRGIAYLSTENDVLSRFVFLLPNPDAKKTFSNEIDRMVTNIIKTKKHW